MYCPSLIQRLLAEWVGSVYKGPSLVLQLLQLQQLFRLSTHLKNLGGFFEGEFFLSMCERRETVVAQGYTIEFPYFLGGFFEGDFFLFMCER